MTRIRQALKALRQYRTLLSEARHLEPHTPAVQVRLELEVQRVSHEEWALDRLIAKEREHPAYRKHREEAACG